MSTIIFNGNFSGPVPGTTDEYILRVALADHQPIQVTAAEEMQGVYPLIVEARSLSALSEEPRHAFIKIKCPKLKAIDLVVRDPESSEGSFQMELAPVAFSEADTVPENIHVFYDLSDSSPDSEVATQSYTILPGRRTRTIEHK